MAEENSTAAGASTKLGQDGNANRRPGCSKWNIILFLVFAGIATALLGVSAVTRYYEKKALATLSSNAQAVFQQWLEEEVTLPESFTQPTTVDESLEARKEAFFHSIGSQVKLSYSYFADSASTTKVNNLGTTQTVKQDVTYVVSRGLPLEGPMLDGASSTVLSARPVVNEQLVCYRIQTMY